MMNSHRRFNITTIDDVDELVAKFSMTWTRCTGFRIHGYLWLNDSFSEDGAQEYAVFKPVWEGGEQVGWDQIESITVSWCTPEKLRVYVYCCIQGQWDVSVWHTPSVVQLNLEEADHHCALCA
jgi:hypothetical protein